MIEADRLLDGLARTLEETVLPSVGSGYARGQLFAVLDVLANLQGQVQWGGPALDHEATTLETLAAEALALGEGALDPVLHERAEAMARSGAAPLAERLRAGRELVVALIEAGCADRGPLAATIDGYLTSDTLFKAMALRPTRLAEISQG
jgi:hypothetical protein